MPGGTMRCLLGFLLALGPVGERCVLHAQAASDTLPRRVVSQAYEAFNRHDPTAFLAFFAPVWYHTVAVGYGGRTLPPGARRERS